MEKSIKAARKVGAEYDEARALLDLAVIGETPQRELQLEAIVILRRLHSVIPYAEKWQLAGLESDDCVAPFLPRESSNN